MATKTTSLTKKMGVPRLMPLDALMQAAECLKTLAHPHRLRMVQMLLQGRYTVGQLAAACGIASPMASEHLRLMQRCGFLNSEKEGRSAYYYIIEKHLGSMMSCLDARFGGKTE
jgi:DNA-binding transcriptional ArsR family regulator